MSSLARDQDDVIIALRGFFAEEKADDIRTLEDDDNLFDAGVLDSLQLVSLVVFIESAFGCVLDFDELEEESLASLIAIRDLIQRKRDEAQRGS